MTPTTHQNMMKPPTHPTPEELYANITRVLMLLGVSKDSISPSAYFYQDLKLSRFDKNLLLTSLEFRFNIIIPEAVTSQLINMKRTVEYIVTADSKSIL